MKKKSISLFIAIAITLQPSLTVSANPINKVNKGISVLATSTQATGVAKAVSLQTPTNIYANQNNTIQGSATSTNGVLYKYWIYDIVSNTWSVLRDYSSDSTAVWNPTHVGSYKVVMDVKDSKSVTKDYDDYSDITVNVTTPVINLPDTIHNGLTINHVTFDAYSNFTYGKYYTETVHSNRTILENNSNGSNLIKVLPMQWYVPANHIFTIDFSKDVDPSTVNERNVWVENLTGYNGGGFRSLTYARLELHVNGSKVTFQLANGRQWDKCANYIVTLANIKAKDGTTLAKKTAMCFCTEKDDKIMEDCYTSNDLVRENDSTLTDSGNQLEAYIKTDKYWGAYRYQANRNITATSKLYTSAQVNAFCDEIEKQIAQTPLYIETWNKAYCDDLYPSSSLTDYTAGATKFNGYQSLVLHSQDYMNRECPAGFSGYDKLKFERLGYDTDTVADSTSKNDLYRNNSFINNGYEAYVPSDRYVLTSTGIMDKDLQIFIDNATWNNNLTDEHKQYTQDTSSNEYLNPYYYMFTIYMHR